MFLVLFACSPTSDAKEEAKVTVHTQPAQSKLVVPKGEPDPGRQSFAEGMAALCDSYAKAPKSDDPIESQKLLHSWIEEHVTNKRVREVFTLVGTVPPKQRSGMLRAAAAKVGIRECALAGPNQSEPK